MSGKLLGFPYLWTVWTDTIRVLKISFDNTKSATTFCDFTVGIVKEIFIMSWSYNYNIYFQLIKAEQCFAELNYALRNRTFSQYLSPSL